MMRVTPKDNKAAVPATQEPFITSCCRVLFIKPPFWCHFIPSLPPPLLLLLLLQANFHPELIKVSSDIIESFI